jgi:hypothetical protein
MWQPVLKWSLLALAAVGCWAAVQQARQVSVLPAVPDKVVSTAHGVAADTVLVTYFSSDVRCATCVRIERLTRETVERNFGRELASGRLQLRTVNLDATGNGHFIQDYQLISKTVIVSSLAQGKEVGWENLQGVWTRQKDERAFDEYVTAAIRRHLGQST